MAESDKTFMEHARLESKKSADPDTKVGACIVNKDGKIVGIGYNCMPLNKDNEYPWQKGSNMYEHKYSYVCHAELNAVMNSFSPDLKGSRIYVTLFPCNECAKVVAQSGIIEVIYDEIRRQLWQTDASERILKTSGIPYRQYQRLE